MGHDPLRGEPGEPSVGMAGQFALHQLGHAAREARAEQKLVGAGNEPVVANQGVDRGQAEVVRRLGGRFNAWRLDRQSRSARARLWPRHRLDHRTSSLLVHAIAGR